MKIKLICLGKTNKSYLKEGEIDYLKRLNHYLPVEKIEIPEIRNAKKLSLDQIRHKEAQFILSELKLGEQLILLDEKGKSFGSIEFSKYIQKKMNLGGKSIVFVVGGAYGFSDEIYKKSIDKISLSNMTFSHQMVRMFFLEQLYRAFSILKGEPYHHE